jgi:hypothetical protein
MNGLRRRGLTPTAHTHAIVMHAYRNREQYESAVRYFWQVHKESFPDTDFDTTPRSNRFMVSPPCSTSRNTAPFSPQVNHVTYCEALQSLFRMKQAASADNVLRHMMRQPPPLFIPNTRFYNLLIWGFMCNNDLERAQKVHYFMDRHKVEKNSWTFHFLLRLYVQLGKDEIVLRLFEELVAQSENQRQRKEESQSEHQEERATRRQTQCEVGEENASISAYNVMLREACRRQHFPSVWDIYSQLIHHHKSPSTHTLNILIEGFLSAGHFHHGCALILNFFSHLKHTKRPSHTADANIPLPDVVTMNLLLKYCSRGLHVVPEFWRMLYRVALPHSNFTETSPLFHQECQSKTPCSCQSQTEDVPKSQILSGAWNLLDLMSSLRIRPDAITLSTFLYTMAKAWSFPQSVSLLPALLNDLVSTTTPHSTSNPTVCTSSRLLDPPLSCTYHNSCPKLSHFKLKLHTLCRLNSLGRQFQQVSQSAKGRQVVYTFLIKAGASNSDR